MKEEIKVIDNYEDFRKVFIIFRDYPFFEELSLSEIDEEFNYIKKEGESFGYYLDKQIVGLLNIIYKAKESQPIEFLDPTKVMYISDIAILNEFRGRGYAKKLADFAINYTISLNKYELMYLRTNLINSMSEGIFTSRGFEVYYQDGNILTEEVSFKRSKSDLEEVDIRKFLVKKIR